MTYGVDQCRCCGVRIEARGANALAEYEAAQRRPPTMPEVKWRRMGYLAAPTRYQINHPEDGCCGPCAEKEMRRKWKPGARAMWILGAGAVVAVILISLVMYLT